MELRSIDSDSGSNRSKKSGSSVLMQMSMQAPNGMPMGNLPPVPPSYANHMMINNPNQSNGDVTNHNNQNFRSNPSGNPNEFFVDVM